MKWFSGSVAGIAAASIFLTALSSCKRASETMRSDLGEAGYKLTPEDWFRASRENDVEALKKFVSSGFATDTRDGEGNTALHSAASSGAQGSADFLLDRGVAIDLKGGAGRTPLMSAVVAKQTAMVRWLLQQGANPRLKDDEGFKPLMLAVREGSAGAVEELAAYDRGDLDHAILLAALVGRADVIDALTNFGASVYSRMEDGRTPLMVAAENGHKECVELLLDLGAGRFTTDPEGRTAADRATAAGYPEISAILLREPLQKELTLEGPTDLAGELDRIVDTAVVKAEGRSASHVSGGGGPSSSTRSPEIAGQQSGSQSQRGSRAATVSIEGAVLSAPVAETGPTVVKRDSGSSSSNAGPDTSTAFKMPPLVMRTYREREVPLTVEKVNGDTATMRISGASSREVQLRAGQKIPGTALSVVKVQKKIEDGKLNQGLPAEISVVQVRDDSTGRSREWISGDPSAAHDPVALVEDAATGNRYIASPGQRFTGADGTEYFVSDVRPNQLVIRETATGEVRTIPLRGPRG